MTPPNTPNEIEAIVDEACSIIGMFNEDGNIDIELTARMINLIRTTLTQQHTQHREQTERERERYIEVVKTYGVKMSALQQEMIGTAHDDCKQMLAYDMHSRLIAVKHITEALSAIS